MNKKIIMGILLCAAGLTSLFGSGTVFAFSLFGKSTVDQPLKEVYFSSGGDMQGSFHAMSIRPADDQTALVCYEDAAWHNEAISVREYLVPISLLDEIKAIFNSNKLVRCENASESKFIVLDGATSSYSFRFEERRVRFSSNQELSSDNYQALRDIKDCVAAACEKSERLPGLVLKKDEQGNPPLRYSMQEEVFAIRVIGYKNKTLLISIENGFAEEKKISLLSQLTSAEDPDTIIVLNDTTKTMSLYPRSNEEYRLTLEQRLAPGKYRLTLGGYTAEFEIR